jgi:hypothetical protein
MTSESDILEDILKNQKPIDAQIQSAEQELAALDEKRKALQAKIDQLKGQKQVIADEQLRFGRQYESNVTKESTQEHKIALFRSLFRGRDDVFPRRFESKRTGKVGTSRYVEMSGSGLFVRNQKLNAVIVKTGILYHFPTILFETT